MLVVPIRNMSRKKFGSWKATCSPLLNKFKTVFGFRWNIHTPKVTHMHNCMHEHTHTYTHACLQSTDMHPQASECINTHTHIHRCEFTHSPFFSLSSVRCFLNNLLTVYSRSSLFISRTASVWTPGLHIFVRKKNISL